MTRSMRGILAAVFAAMFVAGGAMAAEPKEKPEKAKGENKAAKAAVAVSRPAFLDPEHAPKGRGWFPLFNGKDLKGWKFFPADGENSWKVENGVLKSDFPAGKHGVNLYTEKTFTDFELYYEFRVPKDGNSGVFLRGLFEVQVQDDKGVPSDKPKDWGNGGIYGQKAPSKNVSKAAGEWQSAYVTMIGKEITVYLNGEKIIDKWQPPRPTHRYDEMKDVPESGPGPIILQGDHKPIEYRNIYLKQLKAKP